MKETPEYPIQEMSEPAREYLKLLKTNGNRRGRKVNGRNYPWVRLGIGQSFIVEDTRLESIRSSALEAQRKLNRSFVCFQHAPFLPDYPFGVIEVIRIEKRDNSKFKPYPYATDPHPNTYLPHTPGTPWPDYKDIEEAHKKYMESNGLQRQETNDRTHV